MERQTVEFCVRSRSIGSNMKSTTAKPSVTIIIPCFNESESAPHLIRSLVTLNQTMSASFEIHFLIVDDGSTDGTADRLKRDINFSNVLILRHEVNRGLGAALKTAFANCATQYAVTTDSDGTYGFEQVPTILRKLIESGADVVTASPYHPEGGVENISPHRLVLSKGASLLYRALISRDIHTYTALFRAFRCEVLQKVKLESDGFLAVTEFLVKALLAGYNVVEFPTLLRVRQHGSSKARLVRIILSHLGFQARLILKLT